MAETEVDVLVVDTDYGVQITPASAPVPFKNFRYPFVDQEENILFISNDPYRYNPAKKANGIYRSYASDGRLECLVIEDDLAPDDGSPIGKILGLRTDSKSFSFNRGGDLGKGIYASFNGGPIVTIASRKTLAPGRNRFFNSFYYADIIGDRVVFNGSPQNDKAWLTGIYLYDHKDKRTRELITNTEPVPVAGGANLWWLSEQPFINENWLLFSASRDVDCMGNKSEKGTKGLLGWKIEPEGSPNRMFAKERLQVLAPFGMEIPESGGLILTSASAPVAHQGIIAMVAGNNPPERYGSPPKYQSISYRTEDGRWHNPVDTNTLNPILNDGTYFTSFNKWVATQDKKVIFIAKGPSNYEAIYIYDTERDILFFVADTRLEIGSKSVEGFETSSKPLVGNRLAMMIYFDDGSAGVYQATLPKLPTDIVRKNPDAEPSK